MKNLHNITIVQNLFTKFINEKIMKKFDNKFIKVVEGIIVIDDSIKVKIFAEYFNISIFLRNISFVFDSVMALNISFHMKDSRIQSIAQEIEFG